jgi:hypothetical protein
MECGSLAELRKKAAQNATFKKSPEIWTTKSLLGTKIAHGHTASFIKEDRKGWATSSPLRLQSGGDPNSSTRNAY